MSNECPNCGNEQIMLCTFCYDDNWAQSMTEENARLRAEATDLRSLVCEVALGITHSTACTPETPCVRCERDALRAEAGRLWWALEHARSKLAATQLVTHPRVYSKMVYDTLTAIRTALAESSPPAPESKP